MSTQIRQRVRKSRALTPDNCNRYIFVYGPNYHALLHRYKILIPVVMTWHIGTNTRTYALDGGVSSGVTGHNIDYFLHLFANIK